MWLRFYWSKKDNEEQVFKNWDLTNPPAVQEMWIRQEKNNSPSKNTSCNPVLLHTAEVNHLCYRLLIYLATRKRTFSVVILFSSVLINSLKSYRQLSMGLIPGEAMQTSHASDCHSSNATCCNPSSLVRLREHHFPPEFPSKPVCNRKQA